MGEFRLVIEWELREQASRVPRCWWSMVSRNWRNSTAACADPTSPVNDEQVIAVFIDFGAIGRLQAILDRELMQAEALL